ncbi:Gfo/Idh/MocA family protein [Rufibacter glacialis]|uniref:Gfo/Idh/MocA family oxidoreductase n=1 Tax=Rufibacter glacialis TaxID=1259555 RepID=A0A5M8Q6F4_9BACT|nr:Gfo/Idh/MocA family oxidoreductase [Rufibacter glacialis]KAA6430651.1 Gfo/Idh/MocA family oxidoreductase [Rufibacter glacialis]GGK85448.1 oxidoreductase [Rufibacter glacialis]
MAETLRNPIRWGIIGCGDVTEVKSGPAFQKVPHSQLVAVMRRDAAKAQDYARRHGVPKWYDNAQALIQDPEVDAVYIATPPGSHAEYTLQVASARKPVYVEKPMALNFAQCLQMVTACETAQVPLFVAYYRRCLPSFLKVKELVDGGAIGEVKFVNLKLYHPAQENLSPENLPWRVQPELSGGGLFFDLASHQLDFLDFLLGPVISASGQTANQAGLYPAEDIVTGQFRFGNGVLGTGTWCFTVPPAQFTDQTEVIGTKGKITFPSFALTPVILETAAGVEEFLLPPPPHVQQPFIETVVQDLLGKGTCPSTGASALRTAWVMDQIVGR